MFCMKVSTFLDLIPSALPSSLPRLHLISLPPPTKQIFTTPTIYLFLAIQPDGCSSGWQRTDQTDGRSAVPLLRCSMSSYSCTAAMVPSRESLPLQAGEAKSPPDACGAGYSCCCCCYYGQCQATLPASLRLA